MKFVASIITGMVVLLNPVFAIDMEEEILNFSHTYEKRVEEAVKNNSLKASELKTSQVEIIEKNKKFEMPSYPTSVTCWLSNWCSGRDVRVDQAYVYSTCYSTTFHIRNLETIVGIAELKYFPVPGGFRPRFQERMTNLSKIRPMTNDEKLEALSTGVPSFFIKTHFEPKALEAALNTIDMQTHPSEMVPYGMDLGLTMPVLYLGYIDINERYQRHGHGNRALETIFTAFRNSSVFPKYFHIVFQYKRSL